MTEEQKKPVNLITGKSDYEIAESIHARAKAIFDSLAQLMDEAHASKLQLQYGQMHMQMPHNRHRISGLAVIKYLATD